MFSFNRLFKTAAPTIGGLEEKLSAIELPEGRIPLIERCLQEYFRGERRTLNVENVGLVGDNRLRFYITIEGRGHVEGAKEHYYPTLAPRLTLFRGLVYTVVAD